MIYRIFTLLFSFSVELLCQPICADNPSLKTHSTKAFVENKGQIIDQNNNPNPDVLFLLSTPGMNLQLRKGGFSYDLYGPILQGNRTSIDAMPSVEKFLFHRIDIDLIEFNPDYTIETSGPATDYMNYFTSGTPAKGITNVRSYKAVTYKNIYPGIDLEFMINPEHGYKYNFMIHPEPISMIYD